MCAPYRKRSRACITVEEGPATGAQVANCANRGKRTVIEPNVPAESALAIIAVASRIAMISRCAWSVNRLRLGYWLRTRKSPDSLGCFDVSPTKFW